MTDVVPPPIGANPPIIVRLQVNATVGLHIQKRDSLLVTSTFYIFAHVAGRPPFSTVRTAYGITTANGCRTRVTMYVHYSGVYLRTYAGEGLHGRVFCSPRKCIFESLWPPAGHIERYQEEFDTVNVCLRSCQSTAVLRLAEVLVIFTKALRH